jgi:pilus assembly protein Flp/PilA
VKISALFLQRVGQISQIFNFYYFRNGWNSQPLKGPIMNKFVKRVRGVIVGDRGASAIEYALLVGLVSVAIIVAVTALGGQLGTIFQSVVTALGG